MSVLAATDIAPLPGLRAAPPVPPTTVAVVPARGGSKGLPGKNLATVGGISLVGRAVLAAREASLVDLVVVSTDDPAIAKEADRLGATVVWRPADLAGDTSSSEDAVDHAVEALAADGCKPEYVAMVQCTSPFTAGPHVDAVLEPVLAGRAECAFSAVDFHGFLWRREPSGAVGVNHDEATRRQRRQDLAEQVLENGAVYAFSVVGLRTSRSRFHGRVEAVVVDAPRLPEIDTHADLALARVADGVVEPSLPPALSPPRLLVLDFDGVFTDNRVLVGEDGRESVLCHRGDGHGLARLRRHVRIVVLSTEVNGVVSARCAKLGIECVQGLGDRKAHMLRQLTAEWHVPLDDVWYVGNDVNDLDCMSAAGTSVAVADAAPAVLAASDLVLRHPGGRGALRELSDLLLTAYEQRLLQGGSTA